MTRKRRPSFDSSQLGFTFEAPRPVSMPAELAGRDRMYAAAVAKILKDDPRSRPEIAGAMSALMSQDVSALMLDGYASEARDNVNISAARWEALIVVTGRFDILDAMINRIGARVIIGDEIILTEMGHLDQRIAEMKARRRTLATIAKPIKRGGN